MANKRKRETELDDVPPDALLQILSRLEHEDRLSMSLMSRLFLSLTNQFVHKLRFYKCLPSSDSAFQKIFTRFSSVNRVAIRSTRIAHALTLIKESGLKIEGLEIYVLGKNLLNAHCRSSLSGMLQLVKYLKFQCFSDVVESKAIEFINLFESLEELDLSVYPESLGFSGFTWRDRDIYLLAKTLKSRNLHKVNLNHNIYIAYNSLDAFQRFINLEHINLDGCFGMAFDHIWLFLRKATNLRSLEFSIMRKPQYRKICTRKPVGENLSHLSIKGDFITDYFLIFFIASFRSPLTSLEFKPDVSSVNSNSYTMRGVSAMLGGFQGLTRLHMYLPWEGSNVHDDKDMSKLVKSLPCLKDVYLLSWSPAYRTLFSLIRNCMLLERINIKSMAGKTHCHLPRGIRKSYSIWCIYLDPWPDTCVQTAIKSTCPALKIFM